MPTLGVPVYGSMAHACDLDCDLPITAGEDYTLRLFQLEADCCGTETSMAWMRIGLTVKVSHSVWKAGWPPRPIGRLLLKCFQARALYSIRQHLPTHPIQPTLLAPDDV